MEFYVEFYCRSFLRIRFWFWIDPFPVNFIRFRVGFGIVWLMHNVQSRSRHISAHARVQWSCANLSINGLSGPRWFELAVQFTVLFFVRQFYFIKKCERNRWFTLRWSEMFIHAAHLAHSPIYAKMGAQLLGARAWTAMYLDRGCKCVKCAWPWWWSVTKTEGQVRVEDHSCR